MLAQIRPTDDYVTDLMRGLPQASPGPLTVRRARAGRYELTTRSGQLIGTTARRPDADLFAKAVPAIRGLALAAAEALALHREGGDGICVECAQPMACATRRAITGALPGQSTSGSA